MFKPNRASKIAKRHNGQTCDYTTTSKQTVRAIRFDEISYKEFIDTKPNFTFKLDKVGKTVIIY